MIRAGCNRQLCNREKKKPRLSIHTPFRSSPRLRHDAPDRQFDAVLLGQDGCERFDFFPTAVGYGGGKRQEHAAREAVVDFLGHIGKPLLIGNPLTTQPGSAAALESIMSCIDFWAEREMGSREFFWGKPPSVG